jgi:Glycosyltransferase sugar-binding region containing DXD motif
VSGSLEVCFNMVKGNVVNIPKVVHVCWKNKDVVNSKSPLILNGLRNIIDMNPDWNVVIYDDSEIEYYLKDHLTYNNYKLIEDCHIVEKSDMWRLFKMFNEGGMYIDIDRLYNIKMSDIVTDGVLCVLPMCLDMDFSQDIMISAPYNPICTTTLNLIIERRKQGYNSGYTYFLGPQTYMHGVTLALLGRQIDTNPSKEDLLAIREKIEQSGFIKMVREDPPYNTAVNKCTNPPDYNEWVAMKKDFYASEDVKHWTGEW